LRLFLVALALLLAALLPAPATAQTPCDGAAPTSFFTLPPGSTGASFVFPYATVDHDNGVASYSLQLKRATGGAVLSTQVVTKAATSALGATGTGQTCYAIPVVPVEQLPRGVPLVATLVAVSSTPELSSAEGAATAPFGATLPPPAIRPNLR
jgi:hypothetical protein